MQLHQRECVRAFAAVVFGSMVPLLHAQDESASKASEQKKWIASLSKQCTAYQKEIVKLEGEKATAVRREQLAVRDRDRRAKVVAEKQHEIDQLQAQLRDEKRKNLDVAPLERRIASLRSEVAEMQALNHELGMELAERRVEVQSLTSQLARTRRWLRDVEADRQALASANRAAEEKIDTLKTRIRKMETEQSRTGFVSVALDFAGQGKLNGPGTGQILLPGKPAVSGAVVPVLVTDHTGVQTSGLASLDPESHSRSAFYFPRMAWDGGSARNINFRRYRTLVPIEVRAGMAKVSLVLRDDAGNQRMFTMNVMVPPGEPVLAYHQFKRQLRDIDSDRAHPYACCLAAHRPVAPLGAELPPLPPASTATLPAVVAAR